MRSLLVAGYMHVTITAEPFDARSLPGSMSRFQAGVLNMMLTCLHDFKLSCSSKIKDGFQRANLKIM